MGYVTPAKDMAVRPGQYVSGEGRLYHPYLAEWREDVSKSKGSSSACIAVRVKTETTQETLLHRLQAWKTRPC